MGMSTEAQTGPLNCLGMGGAWEAHGPTWEMSTERLTGLTFTKVKVPRPGDGGHVARGPAPRPGRTGRGHPAVVSHTGRGPGGHGPRPTGQLRCSALGWPAHNRTGVSADGEAGWCWPAARPSVARLGWQHTSMPSGSGMLPGPALRAPRARRGHRALGLAVPFPVGSACPWLAVAPRSTAGSRP